MNTATSAIASLDEGRKHPRTHLFVAATIYSDKGAVPVRIRNMSPSGALIECADIPEPGVAVNLKRGSLQASGEIAWKVDQKAGVAFSTPVHVANWMSRQRAPHQATVDAIVSDFNTERLGGGSGQTASVLPAISSMETQLLELRGDLAQLGNSLISDADLIANHPEIQMLDVSVQRVDRMLQQLRDD